jgi:2-oxoglutarate dehydrogenase E2 component (dihydrolipoamide succinyltransferase)
MTAFQREMRVRTGRATGTVELLVMALAGLRERYPLFFGAFQEDRTVLVPDGAHIGVTIDVGDGLYLPVIRDASSRSFNEIADALADFQRKARGNGFRPEELSGGNIGLSLSAYTDVIVSQPIVFPGHSCMVSLTGTQRVREPGGVGTFCLGLSYDHRVINGRDAVMFLRELKAVFERRGRLQALAFPERDRTPPDATA